MAWEAAAKGLEIVERDHGDLFIKMGMPGPNLGEGDSIFVQFRSDTNRELYEAVKRLKEAIDRAKNQKGILPWNL